MAANCRYHFSDCSFKADQGGPGHDVVADVQCLHGLDQSDPANIPVSESMTGSHHKTQFGRPECYGSDSSQLVSVFM